MFVELEDYSDPIKGQITVINSFQLSDIGGGLHLDTKATLALNSVELTDYIFQNPFK